MSTVCSSTSAQRVGTWVRSKRKVRRMSRRQLVARTVYELGFEEPDAETVSEDWLKRLELGRPAKITLTILCALSRATRCNVREHAELFLIAGYSSLIDGDEAPNAAVIDFNYGMCLICREALEIIVDAHHDQQISELTEGEILTIIAHAVDLVAQRYLK